MDKNKIVEKKGYSESGGLMLFLLIALEATLAYFLWDGFAQAEALSIVFASVGGLFGLIFLGGFFVINPNEVKVLMFLGNYIGTVSSKGYRWTVPFFYRIQVSTKIRNFETNKIKVNDANGNPIEIAAIITWRVNDAARALFELDNYTQYIHAQSEASLRHLAMKFPYESEQEHVVCLSSDADQVAALLVSGINEKVEIGGIQILEAKIGHLAYAQEIAYAMLQRQQAESIVMARHKIIEGAVGMVEMALERLKEKNIVSLSEDKKAQLVSNLLVVLCSDQNSQPVLDTSAK